MSTYCGKILTGHLPDLSGVAYIFGLKTRVSALVLFGLTCSCFCATFTRKLNKFWPIRSLFELEITKFVNLWCSSRPLVPIWVPTSHRIVCWMVTGSLVPKTPFYHICSTYATSTGSTALGLLPLPLSLINFNAVGLVEVFHEVVIDAALGMMTVCQVLTVSHPFYEQLQKSGQRDDLTQLEGCP